MAFFQLHTLTAYPANNLNRDDLGRPKSLMFGGAPRLRLSSQSLKRAWRLSDVMKAAFDGDQGVRTREFWQALADRLQQEGFARDTLIDHLVPIKHAFEGEPKKKDETTNVASASATDPLSGENPSEDLADDPEEDRRAAPVGKKGKRGARKQNDQPKDPLAANLYFYSRSEREFIEQRVRDSLKAGTPLTVKAVEKEIVPRTCADGSIVHRLRMSPDVAMFGRMVAGRNALTIEGAVQVAHAFTADKAMPDDDFFAAVDDLSKAGDGPGSGHIDTSAFGCGLYYGYVNVHIESLRRNLSNDASQAARILAALVEAVATVAPVGKQNSFAARSYATYAMAELGTAQPRSFADAFVRAVDSEDVRAAAIERLRNERASLLRAFPRQSTEHAELNRLTGDGTLDELCALARKACA